VPASATRPGFGLAAKIFAASTLVVVAVLTASFGLTSLQANRTADEAVRRALDRTRRSVQAQLEARERAIAGISAASAAIPTFRDRILESEELSDRLDQADEYRDLVGATWALVTDDQGLLLARTDRPDPDEVGRDLSGGALIADPLVGEPATGAWLEGAVSDSIRLFLAVGTPLADPGAAPRGVLVAAFELNDSLAAEFAASFDSIDIAFFALDQEGRPAVVGSTLPRGELTPVLAATLDTAALAADTLVSAISAELGGRHLLGLTGPIRSAAGDVFGGFVAFRARETELGAFQALRRTMWVAVIVGVLLALVSAALLGRQIASPVRRLVAATHQVQDGDYEVEIPSGGRDEIGVLARAFRGLVEDLKEKQDLVEYMVSVTGGAVTQPLDAARTEIRAAAQARQSVGSGGDALRPGSVFAGRYEVKEILGVGGMGVVYRALDRELGEPVAIKTLRSEVIGSDGVALERFKQEIRLARKITHRNVVRTYDLGEVNGTYYLTMEFVEGTPLKELIRTRGKLPVPVTLTIGKQLCRALEVAHEQGVIHRDIKPQNVVVEPNGFLKVMDFGIARLAAPSQGQGLTEVGTAVGTPDYMSPEQLTGEELDPRSDLYSAGVVLYECLTGRLPFVADTVYALVAKHLEEEPPDPRGANPDIPAPLAQLVMRAMAKRREDRYGSAGELHDALAAMG
jgi:serine/threonine-protein kinase